MQLITATWCLPVDREPMANGGIVIDADRIVAVGTRADLERQHPKATAAHHAGRVLMAGLVNPHFHIDLTQFAPALPPHAAMQESGASLHTRWLRESLLYRGTEPLERTVSGIRNAFARLQHFGITTVGALSSYEGALELAKSSALRVTVFLELFGSNPPMLSQDRFESALALADQYREAHARLRVGLAPLAPYLLSRNLLQIISQHARTERLPVQIHVAESIDEMEFFFNATGPIGTEIFPLLGWGPAAGHDLPPAFQQTPLRYLEEIGFLETAPTLVGAVQLSHTDLPLVQERRCPVIFSPQAVSTFQLGTFPYGKLRQQEIPVALGTEARFGPSAGDLWDEMRAALHVSGVTPAIALTMATLGGATALDRAQDVGSLTPGKYADYLLVDAPAETTTDMLVASLIRQTSPQQITEVVVGGQSIAHA